MFGLAFEALSRLSVILHCGTRCGHKEIGNELGAVARPANQWALKVLMALSAAFDLCACGGTNCVLIWYSSLVRRIIFVASLSVTCL